jgi:hypothetical protein
MAIETPKLKMRKLSVLHTLHFAGMLTVCRVDDNVMECVSALNFSVVFSNEFSLLLYWHSCKG